jgi:hypothetical protein
MMRAEGGLGAIAGQTNLAALTLLQFTFFFPSPFCDNYTSCLGFKLLLIISTYWLREKSL